MGAQRSVSSPIHQGPLGGIVKRGGSLGLVEVTVLLSDREGVGPAVGEPVVSFDGDDDVGRGGG